MIKIKNVMVVTRFVYCINECKRSPSVKYSVSNKRMPEIYSIDMIVMHVA